MDCYRRSFFACRRIRDDILGRSHNSSWLFRVSFMIHAIQFSVLDLIKGKGTIYPVNLHKRTIYPPYHNPKGTIYPPFSYLYYSDYRLPLNNKAIHNKFTFGTPKRVPTAATYTCGRIGPNVDSCLGRLCVHLSLTRVTPSCTTPLRAPVYLFLANAHQKYLLFKTTNLQYINSSCSNYIKSHLAALKGYELPLRVFS